MSNFLAIATVTEALKQMLDAGLITDVEYEAKKNEILSDL